MIPNRGSSTPLILLRHRTGPVRVPYERCRWAGGLCHPQAEAMNGEKNFDEVVLPHLAAARRLARWLVRNEDDAEDVLQEASLRAFRYFRTFSGGDGRAWFLRIVRNTCAGWRGRRIAALTDVVDEQRPVSPRPTCDPETLLLR